MKTNMMHLITSLEPGGAENLLVNVVRYMDHARFGIHAGFIYGRGTLASELEAAGATVVDFSAGGRINPWAAVTIPIYLRKNRIKLVHCHLMHAAVAGRVLAGVAGVKSVVSTRHYAYDRKNNRLLGRSERLTARLEKKTIAVSEAVRDHLVGEEGYSAEKVVVIPNGIDLSGFSAIDVSGTILTTGEIRLGCVGRLRPEKGHDVHLQAFSLLRNRIPVVTLKIAGSGEMMERLKTLPVELGVQKHVSFLGHVPPGQVSSFLAGLDIFVLASRWEGFGIALAEASACGLPVVSTTVGGITEVVKDGVTGLLVPPDDPGALADAIEHLAGNPALARQMGKAGRRFVFDRFDVRNTAARLMEVYDDLLNADD